MALDVIFKPNGEDELHFDFASKMSITKKRNTPTTVKLTYPDKKPFRDIEAATLQIEYDGFNIFDGKTQRENFAKNQMTFKGLDWLWDFTRKKRTFYQTTATKPNVLFEGAFDNDSDFSEFTGMWDAYTTPWITGFNAKRFVVPTQTASFVEYFDAENISAIQYMGNLTKPCFLGSKYRYYYWYDYVDRTKYLCFEPDGWGKTWKDLAFTVNSFDRIREDIYNNVVVWGKEGRGYFPVDADYWTENNIDGWNLWSVGGTFSHDFSTTQTKYGEKSYHIDVNGSAGTPRFETYRNFSDGTNNYINLDNFKEFHVWFWQNTVGMSGDCDVIRVYLEDVNNNKAYTGKTNPANSTWYEFSIITKVQGAPPNNWSFVDAGFDWTKVRRVYLYTSWDFGFTDTADVYFDHLYIRLNPIKSQNISNATGYDATSASKYGFRSFDVNYKPAKTMAQCNTMATNVLNNLKDPTYQVGIDVPYFLPAKLNQQIHGIFYGTETTLPIDSLVWTLNEKGEWKTKIKLGTPRLSTEDILTKYSDLVDIEAFDRGLTYNVY